MLLASKRTGTAQWIEGDGGQPPIQSVPTRCHHQALGDGTRIAGVAGLRQWDQISFEHESSQSQLKCPHDLGPIEVLEEFFVAKLQDLQQDHLSMKSKNQQVMTLSPTSSSLPATNFSFSSRNWSGLISWQEDSDEKCWIMLQDKMGLIWRCAKAWLSPEVPGKMHSMDWMNFKDFWMTVMAPPHDSSILRTWFHVNLSGTWSKTNQSRAPQARWQLKPQVFEPAEAAGKITGSDWNQSDHWCQCDTHLSAINPYLRILSSEHLRPKLASYHCVGTCHGWEDIHHQEDVCQANLSQRTEVWDPPCSEQVCGFEDSYVGGLALVQASTTSDRLLSITEFESVEKVLPGSSMEDALESWWHVIWCQ